jgi:hypothetical protein
MCLCQVSLLSRCSPRYLRSSAWRSCTMFIWTGGHVSLRVVNVTWINLDSLAFILHFLNQFWNKSRSVVVSGKQISKYDLGLNQMDTLHCCVYVSPRKRVCLIMSSSTSSPIPVFSRRITIYYIHIIFIYLFPLSLYVNFHANFLLGLLLGPEVRGNRPLNTIAPHFSTSQRIISSHIPWLCALCRISIEQ